MQDLPRPANLPQGSTPPHVKICGLTRLEDARLAIDLGATFVGLILTAKSPRRIAPAEAAELLIELRRSHGDRVRAIGVYTDEAPDAIARERELLRLDAVQVHGDFEAVASFLPRAAILPAIGIRDAADGKRLVSLHAGYAAIVADAQTEGRSGGTGKTFDHRHVQSALARRRVLLAGGITPDNIEDVVGRLRGGPVPYGFDLSSGVEESPGVKSHALLRAFFAALRHAFLPAAP